MANLRGALYTSARLMGDVNGTLRVRQVGGQRTKLLMRRRTFQGVTEIKVGYLDDTQYPSGRLVRAVAIDNEFGATTPIGTKIPERPFMRRATGDYVDTGTSGEVLQTSADFLTDDFVDTESARTIGDGLLRAIRKQIDTSRSWATPNAPTTEQRKGFNWPLVETFLLRNTAKYELTRGTFPNPDFVEAQRPFNLRGFLYDTAKFIGDVQAVAQGNVSQRLGARISGKITGRIVGELSPTTQGPIGRIQRRGAGRLVGRSRPQ